jgi:hypothetical protein
MRKAQVNKLHFINGKVVERTCGIAICCDRHSVTLVASPTPPDRQSNLLLKNLQRTTFIALKMMGPLVAHACRQAS